MTAAEVIASQSALIEKQRAEFAKVDRERSRAIAAKYQGTRRALTKLYDKRPCWICELRGWCGHREPKVDLAEMER